MNRKFLFLVILTLLLVTVICSSVTKSQVFAAKPRAPATAQNCVETKPTMKGAVVAERCCNTTTTFNAQGQAIFSDTSCNVCEYSGGGGLVGCHAIMGAPPGGLTPIPKAGSEPSSVLPPPSTSEQSNNTNPLEGKTLKHGEALKGGSEPNSGIMIKSKDTLQ